MVHQQKHIVILSRMHLVASVRVYNMHQDTKSARLIAVSKHTFIPDKTRTASLLNRLKNEPFRKFIDEEILKMDLVWLVKSSKKFIENEKRVLSIYKDTH